jgi:hypothetical protein
MSEVFFGANTSFKNRSIAGLLIDGGRGDAPLTDEQIFRLAPSAFAEGKHASRTDRYTYIPTIQVAQALRAEGFYPVAAAQGKSRTEGKAEYTKHMIRFRRDLDVGDYTGAVPETVLINSHDGTSSYWLLEGAFRGACKNGLIVCEGDTQGIKVGHSGKIIDRVIEGSYRVIDNAVKAVETTRQWAQIELKPQEQTAFAVAAAALRFDAETQRVRAQELIQVRRKEDEGNDLWTVFNRAQEALIRGGQGYRSEAGRNVRSRAIKSIDGNVGLNRALWTLGAEMARLKA